MTFGVTFTIYLAICTCMLFRRSYQTLSSLLSIVLSLVQMYSSMAHSTKTCKFSGISSFAACVVKYCVLHKFVLS